MRVASETRMLRSALEPASVGRDARSLGAFGSVTASASGTWRDRLGAEGPAVDAATQIRGGVRSRVGDE
jgi:hypothetical protein